MSKFLLTGLNEKIRCVNTSFREDHLKIRPGDAGFTMKKIVYQVTSIEMIGGRKIATLTGVKNWKIDGQPIIVTRDVTKEPHIAVGDEFEEQMED